MFNDESLQDIYRKSAEGKWSYPQLFNALRDIGVERYEVNVLTHEIKYVGAGTSLIHGAPEGFQPLRASASFDEAAIKKALARTQKGETNYIQFLGEIAAAGVPFYRVDMKPRTVTYHGQNRTQKTSRKSPAE